MAEDAAELGGSESARHNYFNSTNHLIVETEEAESGIDPALYASVILLDYVIDVSAAA